MLLLFGRRPPPLNGVEGSAVRGTASWCPCSRATKKTQRRRWPSAHACCRTHPHMPLNAIRIEQEQAVSTEFDSPVARRQATLVRDESDGESVVARIPLVHQDRVSWTEFSKHIRNRKERTHGLAGITLRVEQELNHASTSRLRDVDGAVDRKLRI